LDIEVVMIATILILIILLCAAIYAITNLYKKVVRFEKYFLTVHYKLIQILKDLNALDSMKMFEEDDEVGILWDNVKDILFDLKTLIIGSNVTISNEENESEIDE